MPIDLYPSVAKVKRNNVYQNLPGFVPETGDNSAQAMIANAETSTTAQYTHPKDSYFILNNTLYQADENIPINGTIAVGTNCHIAILGNDVSELIGEVNSESEKINELNATLQADVVASNNGKEYFDIYAVFQRGALDAGVLKPQYSYRVSTDTIMVFDRDITIAIASGFRICCYYYDANDIYTGNGGNQTSSFIVKSNTRFKLEIAKTPEVIVEANINEFIHAVTFESVVGIAAREYTNEFAKTLNPSAQYEGYFKLNGSAISSSNDLWTKKYEIPVGTTKVYVKTRFSALTGVAFSDISDPTTTPLGYPTNCTKDPLSPYLSLTDHVVTYSLPRYYKYVYVPYYKPWGEPIIIAYRESAISTLWDAVHPLSGKNVLVFGDSIAYTYARWRDEFYKITRANELACIANAGAHLTDYNTTTQLDGNYTSTADGGVHNVVCNQVYYWLTNLPSEVEPDVIIIYAGTNDTHTVEQLAVDVNVYTDSNGWLDVDTIERNTFEGAMRWITSKLREQYANALIVFVSPIQSAQSIHAVDYQLAKEAKMIKVSDHLSTILVKATSESGITGEFELNNTNGRYLIDGLHPNEKGGIVLGTYIANTLETALKTMPRAVS